MSGSVTLCEICGSNTWAGKPCVMCNDDPKWDWKDEDKRMEAADINQGKFESMNAL